MVPEGEAVVHGALRVLAEVFTGPKLSRKGEGPVETLAGRRVLVVGGSSGDTQGLDRAFRGRLQVQVVTEEEVLESGLGAFDLAVVFRESASSPGLFRLLQHLRIQGPKARVILVLDRVPTRGQRTTLCLLRVDCLLVQPALPEVVVALGIALLVEHWNAFKVCPGCRHTWGTRQAFLEDRAIRPIGIQNMLGRVETGFLLFNHLDCQSTLALPVGPFLDYSHGPRLEQDAFGMPGCRGYCMTPSSRELCDVVCTRRTLMDVLHILKEHFGGGDMESRPLL